VKTKEWLKHHSGYRAEHRKRHPEYAARDNARRKERHRLAHVARADIQDSIRVEAQILKRFSSSSKPPPRAGIQDSIWPQVVRLSVFSARFAPRLRRRYRRLDRPREGVTLSSAP
jgi:hypothetical protein